jgi:putative transposase
VRFAFIAVEKASYPVRMLCRVLDVSRAGFYAWQGRLPSTHAPGRRAARSRDRDDP